MTPVERLQAILDYCDAATKGPFVFGNPSGVAVEVTGADGAMVCDWDLRGRSSPPTLADLTCMLQSRTDTPRLARALLLARKTLLNMSARGSEFARNTLEEVDAILEGKDAE